jgi:spore coat polysaccharide biosynthesis protein SpsF (cytidylyltransferase family)
LKGDLNLTLAQLHSSDQFDEIVVRTSQELSFKGLKEFVKKPA